MLQSVRSTVVIALTLILLPSRTEAQEPCRLLCAPSLKVEPTVTFSPLFSRPRIQSLPEGTIEKATRGAEFEFILAVDIPTQAPRLAFTVEAIWTPFAGTSGNLFTGRSAADVGVAQIRDNPVELEFEVNLEWLHSDQTGGWVSSHVDVVDQFSPADRPKDQSLYTHKLNLELDTSVSVFNWLPERRWLRAVELEGSLDYVATGLPKAGEEIRGERFIDNASRWSFSLVFVIPVAPW